MRQTSFLKALGYSNEAIHGGKPSRGKRKVRRPLDSRYPVHLILRSSVAKKELNMLIPKNRNYIHRLALLKADNFQVRIEGFANVGNHLHLKVRFKRKEHFQQFLKSITALIARHVTGAKKGRPFGKFWDYLAYTKVVKAWAQEKRLDRYIVANAIEGQHGRKWREKYLANQCATGRNSRRGEGEPGAHGREPPT